MEVGSAPTETAALTPEIIEAGLVEIWARALGVSALDADDNFFELGGDSVLAVEMLMEVEERFGEEVPLSILISGLTINTLTDQLSSQNGHASLPDGIGTAVVDEKTAKEGKRKNWRQCCCRCGPRDPNHRFFWSMGSACRR
jgi:acyl carrier protein